jgi:hypothetical protein
MSKLVSFDLDKPNRFFVFSKTCLHPMDKIAQLLGKDKANNWIGLKTMCPPLAFMVLDLCLSY